VVSDAYACAAAARRASGPQQYVQTTSQRWPICRYIPPTFGRGGDPRILVKLEVEIASLPLSTAMLEATAQPLVRSITKMLPDIWFICAYLWHKRAQALARRSRRPTAGCPALAVRTACLKQLMSSCLPLTASFKAPRFFQTQLPVSAAALVSDYSYCCCTPSEPLPSPGHTPGTHVHDTKQWREHPSQRVRDPEATH
jgi:hypothetical protein